MLKLSVTSKLDGIKSFETVCHSKINHASTLHNEAVRRWLRCSGIHLEAPAVTTHNRQITSKRQATD